MNATNYQDLDYICELANNFLREHLIEDSWLERIAKYREILRERAGNPIKKDVLLLAAAQALRSYQYGNTSPDLAKEIANQIDTYYGTETH